MASNTRLLRTAECKWIENTENTFETEMELHLTPAFRFNTCAALKAPSNLCNLHGDGPADAMNLQRLKPLALFVDPRTDYSTFLLSASLTVGLDFCRLGTTRLTN